MKPSYAVLRERERKTRHLQEKVDFPLEQLYKLYVSVMDGAKFLPVLCRLYTRLDPVLITMSSFQLRYPRCSYDVHVFLQERANF